jgi:hypothetical protein
MSSPALHGDLAHFAPAEVLQLLRLAQANGTLELEHSAERVDLVVANGRPVFARTTGAGVRVGQVLIHRGQLEPHALEVAIAMQRLKPDRRIGALLVESGAADPAHVSDAVREVVKRIVYRVLLWRDGAFRFVPGASASAEDVQLDLDLDRLILEGLRLADETRRGEPAQPGAKEA